MLLGVGLVADVGVVLEPVGSLAEGSADLVGALVELAQRVVRGTSAGAGPMWVGVGEHGVSLGLSGEEVLGAVPQSSGHLPGRRGIPSGGLGSSKVCAGASAAAAGAITDATSTTERGAAAVYRGERPCTNRAREPDTTSEVVHRCRRV